MKTVAYLRVSTTRQDVQGQRLAILEYARRHGLHVDEFVEATASAKTSPKRRRLDDLMDALEPGDRLVVSELSRLGRSLGQIVAMLDALAREGIAFIAIKEQIRIEGKQDIQTKVMTTLFALFAEVERDLISERTREGLAKARATGKKLGRPKGSLGVSRLDGKEQEIRHFLQLGRVRRCHCWQPPPLRTVLVTFTTYGSSKPVTDRLPRMARPLMAGVLALFAALLAASNIRQNRPSLPPPMTGPPVARQHPFGLGIALSSDLWFRLAFRLLAFASCNLLFPLRSWPFLAVGLLTRKSDLNGVFLFRIPEIRSG